MSEPQKGKKPVKIKPGSFETLGLSQSILRAIRRKGFQVPTPIQRKSMPAILQGADVVAMARTGSGKTAAFVIPMLQKLESHSAVTGARALVVSPTRELTIQTAHVCRQLSKYTDLRYSVLVGGDSLEVQYAELATNPDVILATPGRLLHHLSTVQTFTLSRLDYITLDEADTLFESHLRDQVTLIMQQTPHQCQTCLFSATLPGVLADFAAAKLRNPAVIRLDADAKLSPLLQIEFFSCAPEMKLPALMWLMTSKVPRTSSVLVFAATKQVVELVVGVLREDSVAAGGVYGAMDQSARASTLARFRAGKLSVLVVTDVAARGLDIPRIDYVINYDYPPKPKLFVHRVGRAARGGAQGKVGFAYSLVTNTDVACMLDLHLFLSRGVKKADTMEAQLDTTSAPPPPADDVTTITAAPPPPDDVSVFGHFPSFVLAPFAERIRHVISSNNELERAVQSAQNSMILYKKTVPVPSRESIERGKAWGEGGGEGPHPIVVSQLRKTKNVDLSSEASRMTFSNKMSSFRPASTVFELGGGGLGGSSKSRKGANVAAADPAAAAMLRARQKHDLVIKKRRQEQEIKQKRGEGSSGVGGLSKSTDEVHVMEGKPASSKGKQKAGGAVTSAVQLAEQLAVQSVLDQQVAAGKVLGQSGKFKDSDFFIQQEQKDRHQQAGYSIEKGAATELESAVLDLIGDDKAAHTAHKHNIVKRYHWDKQKKRYIQLNQQQSVGTRGKVLTSNTSAFARALRHKAEGGGGGEERPGRGGAGGKGAGKTGKGVKKRGKQAGLERGKERYEAWSRKNKMAVAASGREEKRGGAGFARGLDKRFQHGGRGWRNPYSQKADVSDGAATSTTARGGVRTSGYAGVKRVEQIRRERKLAAKKQSMKRKGGSVKKGAKLKGKGKRGR